MSDGLTSRQRKQVERISGGSRVLAELAFDSLSLRELNSDAPAKCRYHSAQEFFLTHGLLYRVQPFPSRYRKWIGKHHDCLYNALALSIECRELDYAEGFAMLEEATGHPFAHAWCVDATGNVVDPTLHRRIGVEYCGLALDKHILSRSHHAGEPFGFVFNDHLFWEVVTGKQDWRKWLAKGSSCCHPERRLTSRLPTGAKRAGATGPVHCAKDERCRRNLRTAHGGQQ